jgi:hypothetical protein
MDDHTTATSSNGIKLPRRPYDFEDIIKHTIFFHASWSGFLGEIGLSKP